MSNIPIFLKDIYVPIRIWMENNLINFGSTSDISQITENIFVGNLSTSTNKKLLKENGITHILTVMSHFDPLYNDDFKYLHIKAYDKTNFDISQFFSESNLFILDGTTDNHKIFIHCMFGTSRSVILTMAYLIRYKKYANIKELLAFIQSKRPCANPNKGFMKQLELHYNIFLKTK